MNVIGSDVAFH